MKKIINVALNSFTYLLVLLLLAYSSLITYDIMKLLCKGYEYPLLYLHASTFYSVLLLIGLIHLIWIFFRNISYRRFLSVLMLFFSVFWAALYLTRAISLL